MEHVGLDFTSLFMTILNLVILIAIIFVIVTAIKNFKSFTSKNKEIDKKLDDILNRLDEKDKDDNDK